MSAEFDEKAAIEQAVKGIYHSHHDDDLCRNDSRLSFDRIAFVIGARWQFDQMKAQLDEKNE